jgi:protein-L-isoaspartate(D-aspartate) O-methyltransferase
MNDPIDPQRLMRFVLDMRTAGVTDARALSALERTPRDHYAPAHLAALAYDDSGLPLPCGQSMTCPSVVGRMIAALDVREGANVLEIGAGSGFQAAALATLARKVTTLDRFRQLVTDARERFGLARLMHVHAHLADGRDGYGENAPYDRIVANGAVDAPPAAWRAQLAADGVIIAPVGERLMRWRAGVEEDLGPIKFAPLAQGIAPD